MKCELLVGLTIRSDFWGIFLAETFVLSGGFSGAQPIFAGYRNKSHRLNLREVVLLVQDEGTLWVIVSKLFIVLTGHNFQKIKLRLHLRLLLYLNLLLPVVWCACLPNFLRLCIYLHRFRAQHAAACISLALGGQFLHWLLSWRFRDDIQLLWVARIPGCCIIFSREPPLFCNLILKWEAGIFFWAHILVSTIFDHHVFALVQIKTIVQI